MKKEIKHSQWQAFRNITQLLTLKPAARKQGRFIEARDLGVIRDASIVAKNGKVFWVGKEAGMPSALKKNIPKAFQADCRGLTVMPGFVECHTHTVFAGNRAAEFEQRCQGLSYQEIAKLGGGIVSTVRSTRKAGQDELIDQAQERVNEFIRQGVSTLEIKSGYALSDSGEKKMLEVARQLKGPRIVTTYLGPHAPAMNRSIESYLNEIMTKTLPSLARQRLCDRVDVFVEKGYFNKEQARQYLTKARELGLGLSVHADQLSIAGGTDLAIEMKVQSADHLVQIKKPQTRRISDSEVTCVLLPGADFYLKIKYPPARALIDHGARVALATDFNPGSCPSQSLSLVGVLARLEMSMSLPEVISAYTVGASYALGLSDFIGSIEVGKDCDIVILDRPWTQLFYSIGEKPVLDVYRSGKSLFRRVK